MAEEARVLLIEDELRTADFVATWLQLDGHDVVVAEDVDAGVLLAATEPFDAFVVDLALVGSSGLDVVGRIRDSAGEDAPVIVLSEHDDRITRRACLDAGASAFVVKPLMVETLRERLKEQLTRRRGATG
jgi:two-component system, OmpR family, response regulator AdeR